MTPSQKYHIRYFHYLYALKALHFLEKKKIRLLDVGCGRGELTQSLAQKAHKGSQITACDIDEKALKDFASHLPKNLDIEIITCNAQKLPFLKEQFDIVFMFDVLEHVDKPVQVLSEIYRVLRPHGVYHLVVPCEGDLVTIDGWIKKLFQENLKKKPIGHIQQFTFKQMDILLRDAGFIKLHIHYSYYFLYQLFSVIYYTYVYLFKRGNYVQITNPKKKTIMPLSLHYGAIVGGWVVYLETLFWQTLFPLLQGQTGHITLRKEAASSIPPRVR